MAKSIEIIFPKLNHFWMDSGLLGLAIMLRETNSNILSTVNDAGLTLKGSEKAIHKALEKAYELLRKRYYNLSTEKQRKDAVSYNFYYDSKRDKFVAFPKKKSVGIAGLIFNKAPRPVGTSIKWARKKKVEMLINGKVTKRNRGILPRSHAYLQKKMDKFLDKNKLDVTTSGLLVDGPNAIRPRVTLGVKVNSVSEGRCYLCGQEGYILEDASQTIFPFITGTAGLLNFNTLCGSPESICWKCAFLGKFVPVNGFYLSQGDNLFAFFPHSVSLEKMVDIYAPLQDAKYDDPNLNKNFQHPLGFEKYADGYFQKPYETTFAFLYTLYDKLSRRQKGTKTQDALGKMMGLAISKAPLEFIVLHAVSKGQTSMGKMVWLFRDSVYFFRLIKELEKDKISIKEVMRLLIDFSQKNENKTLIRNRVCEQILKKRSTLDLIEHHVFSTDQTYIKPLFDFVIKYEPIVRKEDNNMRIEEQEAAVTLGKRIGMGVAHSGKKGDLFALRKARRKTDFLSELNRLQFKCNLTVPPDVYEGKLTDLNFTEFKHFCMIAALNSFHAATR